MKFSIQQLLKTGLLAVGSAILFTSCNKDVQAPEPVMAAAAITTRTVSDTVTNDASLSILRAAITRASTFTATPSLSALLADRTAEYTFFAPTDAAFATIGVTSSAALAGFRAGQLDTILRYHLVSNKVPSSQIPTTFPNIQLPTQLVLAPPSAAIPVGLRMSVFASRRGTNAWVNNIPIVQTDIMTANAVVHKIASVLIPPSTTIKGLIASNPTKYSILSAAIARADSGLTASAGLGRLDSVINFAAANLTLFAPNNDAFRALFPPGTPDANIIGALNTPSLFTATTVKGLIAYHLLGSRAFSVNFAAGPAPVTTQLVIPNTTTAIPIIVTYAGPAGAFTATGVATGAATATVVTRDQNTINGVVHEINQVLRPQ